jgi:hypothetical protein
VQSPTTTNSSTSSASSQPIVGEPSSQGHSSQTATGLDANFWLTLDAARDRFVLVCGLSPIEKDHLFTVLEEKLDYLANLEESVRKKAVKAAISEIGTLQRWFRAHLRKKYVSKVETSFVKHAFLQQQDYDMFV